MPRIESLFVASMIAVAVGCAADPAADKPAAVVADVAPPPADAAPAPAASAPRAGWTLAAGESKVGFLASKVTKSHEGSFSDLTGGLDWSGRPEGSTVRFAVPLATVKTDSERLDKHLRSPDFFDVERFPEATFDSTAIVPAAGGGGRYDVTGNLALHGATKQVTFPATIVQEGSTVRGRAEFSINRKEFGIAYPGKPDDLIRDDVVLKLDVAWRAPG